jgi:hypothetical protein
MSRREKLTDSRVFYLPVLPPFRASLSDAKQRTFPSKIVVGREALGFFLYCNKLFYLLVHIGG